MLKNLVLGSLLLALLGLLSCQKLSDALADKKLLAVDISIKRPGSPNSTVNTSWPIQKSYGFFDPGYKYMDSSPTAYEQLDTTGFLTHSGRNLLLELSFIDASSKEVVQTLTQERPYSKLFDTTIAVGRFAYENLSNASELKARLAIYDPIIHKLLKQQLNGKKMVLFQNTQDAVIVYSDMAKDFLFGQALGLKFEAEWNTVNFQVKPIKSADFVWGDESRDKYYAVNPPQFAETKVDRANGTVPYFLFNLYADNNSINSISYPPHAVVSSKTFKTSDTTEARLNTFFQQANRELSP